MGVPARGDGRPRPEMGDRPPTPRPDPCPPAPPRGQKRKVIDLSIDSDDDGSVEGRRVRRALGWRKRTKQHKKRLQKDLEVIADHIHFYCEKYLNLRARIAALDD